MPDTKGWISFPLNIETNHKDFPAAIDLLCMVNVEEMGFLQTAIMVAMIQ